MAHAHGRTALAAVIDIRGRGEACRDSRVGDLAPLHHDAHARALAARLAGDRRDAGRIARNDEAVVVHRGHERRRRAPMCVEGAVCGRGGRHGGRRRLVETQRDGRRADGYGADACGRGGRIRDRVRPRVRIVGGVRRRLAFRRPRAMPSPRRGICLEPGVALHKIGSVGRVIEALVGAVGVDGVVVGHVDVVPIAVHLHPVPRVPGTPDPLGDVGAFEAEALHGSLEGVRVPLADGAFLHERPVGIPRRRTVAAIALA